ncbi:MAG: hypothetical protein ACI4HQ_03850 [Acetatifactor sp.]
MRRRKEELYPARKVGRGMRRKKRGKIPHIGRLSGEKRERGRK